MSESRWSIIYYVLSPLQCNKMDGFLKQQHWVLLWSPTSTALWLYSPYAMKAARNARDTRVLCRSDGDPSRRTCGSRSYQTLSSWPLEVRRSREASSARRKCCWYQSCHSLQQWILRQIYQSQPMLCHSAGLIGRTYDPSGWGFFWSRSTATPFLAFSSYSFLASSIDLLTTS